MVKNTFFIALIMVLCIGSLSAQDLTYGFKAGLNFSRINTTDIEQFDGADLESFGQNSGFHLGVVVNTQFSEIFGARGEFLFSQKGGRYEYEGQSYTKLDLVTGEERVTSAGFRSMNLNISNAYIDIPLSVYARPVKWLEISAGINAAVLISSTAAGELSFTELTQTEEEAFRGISLDYRFFRDEIGEAVDNSETEVRMINGVSLEMPKTIKAYYDYPDGAETGLFNRFDFGLHAGLSFFINKSLFVGARVNYGLSDITNDGVDRSLFEIDGDQLILRDDTDRNLSIQASIGFSF